MQFWWRVLCQKCKLLTRVCLHKCTFYSDLVLKKSTLQAYRFHAIWRVVLHVATCRHSRALHPFCDSDSLVIAHDQCRHFFCDDTETEIGRSALSFLHTQFSSIVFHGNLGFNKGGGLSIRHFAKDACRKTIPDIGLSNS